MCQPAQLAALNLTSGAFCVNFALNRFVCFPLIDHLPKLAVYKGIAVLEVSPGLTMSSFERRGKYSSYNPNHQGGGYGNDRYRKDNRVLRDPNESYKPRHQQEFDIPSTAYNTNGFFDQSENESFRFQPPQEEQERFRESEYERNKRDRSPVSVFNRLGHEEQQQQQRDHYDSNKYSFQSHSNEFDRPERAEEPGLLYSNTQKDRQREWERDVSDDIPDFDPENSKMSAHEWVHILEEVGTRENWNSDEKKFWFANKLLGSAKNFLNFRNVMQEPWLSVRKAFIKTYPSDMDYHLLLTEMMGITQGDGDPLTYFNAKLASIKTCNITGQKAVSCLIGGLSSKELRGLAYRNNFQTTEQLFSFLSQNARAEKNNEALAFVTTPDFCNICGSAGHDSSNCETRKHCSKTEQILLAKQDLLSRTITHPKFIVEVKINGRRLRGYVNFDSDEVTMTEEACTLAGLSWRRAYDKVLKSFGDRTVRAFGSVKVNMCVQKAMGKLVCYVVPDKEQAFEVIIGRSFVTIPNVRVNIYDNGVDFYERDEASTSKIEPPLISPPPPPMKKFRNTGKSRYEPKSRRGKLRQHYNLCLILLCMAMVVCRLLVSNFNFLNGLCRVIVDFKALFGQLTSGLFNLFMIMFYLFGGITLGFSAYVCF